jgi:hypothetical protein
LILLKGGYLGPGTGRRGALFCRCEGGVSSVGARPTRTLSRRSRGERDAACPLSTWGGTRLVRLVRGRGGGGCPRAARCARGRGGGGGTDPLSVLSPSGFGYSSHSESPMHCCAQGPALRGRRGARRERTTACSGGRTMGLARCSFEHSCAFGLLDSAPPPPLPPVQSGHVSSRPSLRTNWTYSCADGAGDPTWPASSMVMAHEWKDPAETICRPTESF